MFNLFNRSLWITSFIIPPVLGGMVACTRAPEVPTTTTPGTGSVESLSNKSLTQLSTQRIELLRELETLSAREQELLSLIGAVQSQDAGERQVREQLRNDLREVELHHGPTGNHRRPGRRLQADLNTETTGVNLRSQGPVREEGEPILGTE